MPPTFFGLAPFDFGTQNQLATTLKTKIKEAISFEIVKGFTVEFFGAGFAKYETEKGKVKAGTEFGVVLTISWTKPTGLKEPPSSRRFA